MEKKKDTTFEYLIYILLIFAVILIRTFVVTPVRVNGSSMFPTLHDGEIMLLNKFKYHFNDIKRFDIVVVKTDEDKIIKRVIGLPGENIKLENNLLYVDGQEIKQPFKHGDTMDYNIRILGYNKIPNDCYFVLGDNRNNSKDSRMIGCVKKNQIVGKASLVIYPFKNKGHRY